MTVQSPNMNEAPLGKLFWQMSIPIALALVVGGLYNVVDAFFITRGVGAYALGGVTVAMPIQMIVFAVAGLIGSGAASIIARMLGAKDYEKAQHTFDQAVVMTVAGGIVFALALVWFLPDLVAAIGASPELQPYSLEYLYPVLIASPMVMLMVCFNDLVRAEGKMQLLTISILLSSVLNMIFDPIAIYVLKMGVTGVALATVLAQCIALGFYIYCYASGKTSLKFRIPHVWFNGALMREIIMLGLPIAITNIGMSVVMLLINTKAAMVPGAEGDYLISAYGMVGRVFMFLFLPMMGMIVSYQTICGHNFGAKAYDRVKAITLYAALATTAYCSFWALIMTLTPGPVISIFTNDAELIRHGIVISQYAFFGFFFAGAGNVFAIYFQAIGKAKSSLFLNSARLYLFQIPAILILPDLIGINWLWASYAIGDIMTFLLTAVFIFVALGKLPKVAAA